jgi:ribose transport system permease protein
MARKLIGRLGIRRLSAVYLLIIFVAVFSILRPHTYFTHSTLTVVFNSGVVTCLLALAFLVPLTTGTFDLSIGAVMTFALIVIVKLYLANAMPLPVIAVLAVVLCACIGVINGLIVVRLHVTSFIATLASSQVLLAAALLITNNSTINGDFSSAWLQLGNGSFLGIPFAFYYLMVVAIVMWFVLEWTPLGRYLFATGGNAEAARLSGVATNGMIVGSLAASGALSGLAGVLYTMQIGVANPTVGSGLLFPAITAVFLGASQLSMRPNVWGTILAFFALQFGEQGLDIISGSNAAWSAPMFEGIALVVAVALANRPILARLRSRADHNAVAPDLATIPSDGDARTQNPGQSASNA